MTKQVTKLKDNETETAITKIPLSVRDRLKHYRRVKDSGDQETYAEALVFLMDFYNKHKDCKV